MYIASDLHGHTRYSDGRATPEQYVAFRAELGMRVIAIADHDVFDGVRQGAAASARANMLFVPAAEMTSFLHFGTSEAEQFHILAYYSPDVLRGSLLEQTFFYRRSLKVRTRWQELVLSWLSSLDRDDRAALDPDRGLEALPAADFPALQQTIDLIVARQRSLFEAFRDHHERFWSGDRELFGWTPEDMIDAIRADGAVDIVAHPARYRDKTRTEALLARASGLEVYTSRHKAEVAAHYRDYATANRKLWTASADDHQNARYIRPPCGTPVATLERILRRALPLGLILAA
jgi:3',5'-nucleoside bisphosphate phosphatase